MYGDAYTGFFTVPPGAVIPDAGIANFASGGDDYMDGGNGNDTIVGDALNFSSFRLGGDPHGSGGADILIGGNGDDLLIGDAVFIFVGGTASVSGGDDRLFGGEGNDRLFGDSMGSDAGRGGNDRLFGDAGNDELHGGGGFDILDGGDGVDSVVFNGNRADFGVGGSPDGREFLVGEIATGETDLLTKVEFLVFLDMTIPVGQIL
jgi:Ca2+-binding RTX toxin-like protein